MGLEFQFASLADFMSMKGHGPYVWAAYALTFAGLAALVVQVRLAKKSLRKKIQILRLRESEDQQ
ncbi:heme exporter protein CcmD [Agaribacterium haliotis]|uniref:heme exporter protein CcmD n=1 Tax=Agaribacterium haliotis TaxID=2013869 RepID=UPI000BB53B5F|nr:heme exporter protein CcmD [Agaribacterium haliotis]